MNTKIETHFCKYCKLLIDQTALNRRANVASLNSNIIIKQLPLTTISFLPLHTKNA